MAAKKPALQADPWARPPMDQQAESHETNGTEMVPASTQPATGRDARNRFVKGHPRIPGAGRRKGGVNKFSRELRNAIATATKLAGDQLADKTGQRGETSYLLHLAMLENPAIFGAMLRQKMPAHVTLDATIDVNTTVTFETIADVRAELLRRGIPVDRIYDTPELDENGDLIIDKEPSIASGDGT